MNIGKTGVGDKKGKPYWICYIYENELYTHVNGLFFEFSQNPNFYYVLLIWYNKTSESSVFFKKSFDSLPGM